MFAVIKTGGKQYKVAKDDVITVEKLLGEPGTMVELGDVLMLGGDGSAARIEKSRLTQAAVFAEVLEQSRGDKIVIFKKKRRQNYRRKKGHRQLQTVLRILDVSPTGTKPKFTAKAAAKPEAKPAADKKAADTAKPAEAKAPEKEQKEETKTKAASKKTAKKTGAKKAPAKKAPAKKTAAKKSTAKKSTAKKSGAKKSATKSKPKS